MRLETNFLNFFFRLYIFSTYIFEDLLVPYRYYQFSFLLAYDEHIALFSAFIYTTFPIHSHDDNRTQYIHMAMINDDIKCARLFLWIQQFHLYKYVVSALDFMWFFRKRTTTITENSSTICSM